MAAEKRSKPSSILRAIISIAIIASSTSRPSAMTRAPVEMRCRSMPNQAISTKVPASTSGIVSATTAPARSPRLRKLTASTIATASASTFMKRPTALRTMRGWSETFSTWMPTGRSVPSRSIARSSAAPSSSTSPRGTIDTPRPIACLPPKRIVYSGGST